MGHEVGERRKGCRVKPELQISEDSSEPEKKRRHVGTLSICGIYATLTRQPLHTFPSCLMSNANVKELRLKHWDSRKDLSHAGLH